MSSNYWSPTSTARSTTAAVQTLSISTSLLASGGVAALSLFDVPEVRSQSASRSLPSSVRWLFSRGSYIFPSAACVSGAGFTYLAYVALPARSRVVLQLFRLGSNGIRVNGYLAAAALSISIAPFAGLAMIPTKLGLLKSNDKNRGARGAYRSGHRSTEDLAYEKGKGKGKGKGRGKGKGEGSIFSDLIGPPAETSTRSSRGEDDEARDLLNIFEVMNIARAVFIGAGGIVGLWTALR